MHACPGISLADVLAMTWPDLMNWWNVARAIVEGPAKEGE